MVRFVVGSPIPSPAYLDTNFIINARDRQSSKYQRATQCLAEIIAQNVVPVVTRLIFDELWWVYMGKLYRTARGQDLTAKAYKADPTISRAHWPAIATLTAEVRAWQRLVVLDGSAALVSIASDLMTANHLGPRDAYHLAATIHHNVPCFVTCDNDFDAVTLPGAGALTVMKV